MSQNYTVQIQQTKWQVVKLITTIESAVYMFTTTAEASMCWKKMQLCQQNIILNKLQDIVQNCLQSMTKSDEADVERVALYSVGHVFKLQLRIYKLIAYFIS